MVGRAGGSGHRAPGLGAHIDQVVGDPGGGAFAEIQPEPQLLQQARLEAHEDGGPEVGEGQRLNKGAHGLIGAGMGLALGQRPGRDRSGGRQARQRQGVVEQGRGPLALRLQAGRAQLVGNPGAIADRDRRAGLQEGLHLARGAARHMRRPLSVVGGQQLHDRARLAERAGGEHKGVVLEFQINPRRLCARRRRPASAP